MLWGKPISMSIEPTTACNLSCPQCPSGLKQFTRPTGNLKPALFRKIIDEVAEHLIYLTLYFQGEPFINPHFSEMVRYASQKGIFTATSTNAHFITATVAQEIIESGLGKLIISIDGTDQQTYEQYRVGGELEKVIEGIQNIREAKNRLEVSHPFIELQFIVFKHNSHQKDKIKSLSEEWGVDKLTLKTAQVYDFENGEEWIPDETNFSRYKKTPSGYRLKGKLYNHCWRMWHSNVVSWDGRIVPCCFDKDAEHFLGNIHENEMSAIWEGKSYNEFRGKILSDRKAIEICRNCTEGMKWWI